MLEDHAESVAAPGFATLPALHDIPAPDPAVVESARLRLADRHGARTGQRSLQPAVLAEDDQPPADPADQFLAAADPADDIRAVIAMADAASGLTAKPADALDVGAGLVLLCQLRIYLDRLEADVLDEAENAGLNWDVIAAIMGIPVAAAQHRHAALSARRDPQ
jgi:hypothetical protein